MKDIGSIFGASIRRRRQELGLSQEELADEAGLHRTYVSLLERGLRSASIVTIVKLARALKTTGSELLKGIKLDNHGRA